MTLTSHHHRGAVEAELHARPLILIPRACRMRRHTVLLHGPEEMSRLMAHYARFRAGADTQAEITDRQDSFVSGTRQVIWEFHTEFVTVTWISDLGDWNSEPPGIGLDLLAAAHVVGSTRLDIIDSDAVPERLNAGFQASSLCSSDVDGAQGQVMTDFTVDDAGFIRLEFAAGRLSDLRRSILARRLLEVESYRVTALLSLPLARQYGAELAGLENELTGLMHRLGDFHSARDTRNALDNLQRLSVASEQLRDRLSYRFAASRAYGDVMGARLASLDERPNGKGHLIGRFIANRVDPALATCQAMLNRLDQLSQKLERAVSMMNLRVSLTVQDQSAAALQDMAATARSQYLLQRTVEGLSTAAVSYYVLGILGYVLGGPIGVLHWNKAIVLAVVAVPVVLVVWLGIRRIKLTHTA
jgi:uncharacterized membrane-anchored protein